MEEDRRLEKAWGQEKESEQKASRSRSRLSLSSAVIQRALEQHGFELHGPFTCRFFFPINMCHMIPDWSNPKMQDLGYRRPTVKF